MSFAPVAANAAIRLKARSHTPLGEVFATLFHTYRQRTLVGLALMAAQAFFYNAIFFTYALVLTKFYAVSSNQVGWYILPFAIGNFLGPLLLGRLFDTHRPSCDDRHDLCAVRRAARRLRRALRGRPLVGDRPDASPGW